ncbi:MAG: transposase [bacterium]|nr:transposase [bacterium]
MNLEEWMKRELDDTYLSTMIMKERVYKKVNNVPKKQDVYMIMGINLKGYKRIIDIIVLEEETTSFWFNKMSELKSRGINELFMVSMLDNDHMKKAIKMAYPGVILMPSMMEIYNNTRPYILQKNHRELMRDMQNIYKSKDIEEAKMLYNEIKNKYKDNKLLLMVVDKYIDDIMEVVKYSREARTISSYTFSYLKMRARIVKNLDEYKVFNNNEKIKKYIEM